MTNDQSTHASIALPASDTLQRLAISESGFIFDPVSGHSFSVNETGMRIIRLMQQNQDIAAIMDTLQQEFQAQTATIERDLIEFISMLREQIDANE